MPILKKISKIREYLESISDVDNIALSIFLTELEDEFYILTNHTKCVGCNQSTGETKLFCCNYCGKRIENF